MDTATTRIPARSKEQAMDWSLVLVSQGIESRLDHSEADGWSLLVDAANSQRALGNLRQYRAENRGWPWRRPFGGPAARFDFHCLIWVAVLILFHWVADAVPGLSGAGVMDSRAVAAGQWWRIFTAMTLHADVAHLATNLSLGIVLFGLAMGRFGSGRGLLAAYLAGAVGNVASLILTPKPFHGLGASGMIMGALGLLAAPWLSGRREERGSIREVAGSIGAGVMIFLLYGLTPGTDLAAHSGGFVAGLTLGLLLTRAPAWLAKNPLTDRASVIALTAAVTLTWWLAKAAGH